MRSFLPLLTLASVAQALHFFIDVTAPKCFFEELPKDTLVVGHYTAEEWNDRTQHLHRGGSSGKFTFTAADPGDHKLCFTPSSNSGRANWLSASQPNGGIRLTLDIAIGETSALEGGDKTKLQDLATRVRDLNARLNDIRREQVFQREREAEFRDQSESTNARVIRWILIQLAVLGVTCAWQLSHLRSFFIKQKLT
ncbi:emp24p/erv25p- protein [Collariella sp. IMI 366227]|nr:emp24p/erv25p- protein [Collariella sp. IMI 366227]